MIPLIIMAAASILSAGQKRDEERRQNYLEQLKRQASEFGGNTDMASVLQGGSHINNESANYSNLLSLVGKGGDDASSSDDAPVPGADAAASQYKLDHSFMPNEGGDENDLLDPWKKRRGY